MLPGYEIISELARGGMGIVYMARQRVPERLVAIKMILAGDQARPEDLVRFLREAEAVARLRHPNIIQVYEFGNHAGRPYFTMELVEGGTLADRLAAGPLAPIEAAQLMEAVTRAVQAAHLQGIIHRDIKPRNVLLSEGSASTVEKANSRNPRPPALHPKVTDFGLAKQLQAQPGLTQSQAVLGTPSYMAPEQAAGNAKDVGVAADIYSLGAVLYECLCGRPPFKAATPVDTILQVISVDPPTPRLLQPKLPRDLETICLKCLEKEPSRRYASALALAEDLAHFSAGEPIRARPVRAGERVIKWAKRRPAIAGLLGALALALSLGFVGTIALWLRAENQRALAEAARQDALRQRDRADAGFAQANLQKERADHNLRRARMAVDEYCTSVADDKRLKHQDLHALRKKLLETAVPFYQEFAGQHADDLALRSDQGHALLKLADLRLELGEQESARLEYAQAAEIFIALAGQQPQQPTFSLAAARALRGQAGALAALGRSADAEPLYKQALKLSERLAKDFPSAVEHRREYAKGLNALANLLRQLGRSAEAERTYRQAFDIHQKLAADFPAVPDHRKELGICCNNLGILLHDLGRDEESERIQRIALQLRARLVADFPNEPEHRQYLAWTYGNLGVLLDDLSRKTEAEHSYRQALDLRERLVADFPALPDYRQELALSHNNLGSLLRDLNRPDEADRAYLKAIEIDGKLAADFPSVSSYVLDYAMACGNYAHSLRDNGRPDQALPWYEKSLARIGPILDREPTLSFGRLLRRVFLAGKALALARLGRSSESAALARPLTDDPELDDEARYFTTCALALCSAAKDLPGRPREQDASTSLRLLQQAAAAGYFADPLNLDKLRKDADLAPLRSHSVFKKMLADVEAKTKSK